MKITSIIFLSALLGWQTAWAGALAWKQSRIEIEPAVGEEEAIAYFTFTNKGTQPVEIKSATSSCDTCTSFAWEEKAYQPGEEGQLIATVKLSGINGRTTKILTVTTSEKPPASERLELVVKTPEKLTVSQRSAKWESGSMEPKTVNVVSAFPEAVPYIKEVRPEGLFTVSLSESPEPGKGRQVHITPAGQINEARRALITVGVRDAKGTEYISTITATRR